MVEIKLRHIEVVILTLNFPIVNFPFLGIVSILSPPTIIVFFHAQLNTTTNISVQCHQIRFSDLIVALNCHPLGSPHNSYMYIHLCTSTFDVQPYNKISP